MNGNIYFLTFKSNLINIRFKPNIENVPRINTKDLIIAQLDIKLSGKYADINKSDKTKDSSPKK